MRHRHTFLLCFAWTYVAVLYVSMSDALGPLFSFLLQHCLKTHVWAMWLPDFRRKCSTYVSVLSYLKYFDRRKFAQTCACSSVGILKFLRRNFVRVLDAALPFLNVYIKTRRVVKLVNSVSTFSFTDTPLLREMSTELVREVLHSAPNIHSHATADRLVDHDFCDAFAGCNFSLPYVTAAPYLQFFMSSPERNFISVGKDKSKSRLKCPRALQTMLSLFSLRLVNCFVVAGLF